MLALWRWLFDGGMGPPGLDGHWPFWLCFAYHASNFIIGVSDLSIPIVIVRNWAYKREGIARSALAAVLVYFPVKALSRLVRAAQLYGSPYHAMTVLDVMTAVLTVYCTIHLQPFLRTILRLPSRAELHEVKNALQNKVYEIQLLHNDVAAKNQALLKEIERARAALSSQVWLGDKHAALDRMVTILKEGL
jgi:cell division protein ZapA (FtsZ GTPase activity inhibitor)